MNQNQIRINGMNALMAFTGYECLNGIPNHSHCEARMRVNQNQRYEAPMGFKINGIKPIKALPGYECRMAFCGASTPQNLAYQR